MRTNDLNVKSFILIIQMLLVLTPEQYHNEYIMFSEKTKNNILSGGDFYRYTILILVLHQMDYL